MNTAKYKLHDNSYFKKDILLNFSARSISKFEQNSAVLAGYIDNGS